MKSKFGTALFLIGTAYFISIFALLIIRDSLSLYGVFGASIKPSVFIVAGLLMKSISDKPNFMNNQRGQIKSTVLVSSFAIYFTAVGVIWSFVFFSAEPTINIRYIIALVYYFFGASIIISLVYFKFGKNSHQSLDIIQSEKKAYWSDTIIKFLTFSMSTLFVLGGFYLTLVCIAHSERNFSMILVSILFFLSSLIVTVVMLYKVILYHFALLRT